ncbi:hypothetical protein HYH02_003371 [Chlamydomonas schloesseri]|uniref:Uncharacterized protein n=1 Tax=Chlamydomonas schloesseri TaxID=2026947 RepID=A0A836BA47_9CHLO|nr:hypothetical protein HYH02_003371 [Chlamydomonas schloesseri]|eukprot:KAG2452347.1 hypothetical protein HYH02_003371 [Chlamydomonas schloesseri]
MRRIAGFLPIADVAAGLKLSCKDAAACLRGDEDYSVIQVAAPVPTYRPAEPYKQPLKQIEVAAASPWPGAQFVGHWGRPEPWRRLPLRRRQRLLALAANSGHAPSLDAALAHCGCSLTAEVLAAAAAGTAAGPAAASAAVARLLAEGCDLDLQAVCAAAAAGHLPLVQLLWSKRPFEFRPVVEPVWPVQEVAVAAARGGAGHVLAWLEREAVGGLKPVEEDAWAGHGLVAAAARAGRVELVPRLLDRMQGEARSYAAKLLPHVAYGCPLPLFRQLAERWRALDAPPPERYQGSWMTPGYGGDQPDWPEAAKVLTHAVGGSSPDWRDKAEYVLAKRPEYLDALSTKRRPYVRPPQENLRATVGSLLRKERDAYCLLGAQPDFEQRLRYLVEEHGVRPPAAAAVVAAAVGDVGALRFLLDEGGLQALQDPQQAELLTERLAQAAAGRGRQRVLEFLRGRGLLPAYSRAGITLDPGGGGGAALPPLGVLAATAKVAAMDARYGNAAAHQEHNFWWRVFSRAAEKGADAGALRYLHERGLGVQLDSLAALKRIAQVGSEEALEWALGLAAAAGGAAAAAQQGRPGVGAYDLLISACYHGNLAVASRLLAACRPPPALPSVQGILRGVCSGFNGKLGAFGAVRWLVLQRREQAAAAAAGGGGGLGGRVGWRRGAAASGGGGGPSTGAGSAVEAAAAAVAGGISLKDWRKLLRAVGVSGWLCGNFSVNQWEWLRAAFLSAASPWDEPPHETAVAATAGAAAAAAERERLDRAERALLARRLVLAAVEQKMHRELRRRRRRAARDAAEGENWHDLAELIGFGSDSSSESE